MAGVRPSNQSGEPGWIDVPRKRHQPIRTCVVCGRKDVKRELLRLVRCQDGTAAIDPDGRLPGRGAYVCRVVSHSDARGVGVRIKRALRLESEVTDEFLVELRDWQPSGASGE